MLVLAVAAAGRAANSALLPHAELLLDRERWDLLALVARERGARAALLEGRAAAAIVGKVGQARILTPKAGLFSA